MLKKTLNLETQLFIIMYLAQSFKQNMFWKVEKTEKYIQTFFVSL